MKDPDRVDEYAARFHEEAFEKIDCLDCGNCCKTVSPMLTGEDVRRIAGHLNLTEEAFLAEYGEEDEPGEWFMRRLPCPFLQEDNRCAIYEIRPRDCAEYPHTDKAGFATRTYGHSNNALVCPAVYHIVERLKRVV